MKWIFAALIMFSSLAVYAQDEVSAPEPTQNPSALFRVYRTLNVYMTLELNTETGAILEIQWNPEDNKRFKQALFSLSKEYVGQSLAGRFTLVPTQNVYNFILVDQDKGTVWQVQWGDNAIVLKIEQPQ